jgi:hypothetical protein
VDFPSTFSRVRNPLPLSCLSPSQRGGALTVPPSKAVGRNSYQLILFAPGLASSTPATALRIDNFVDSANFSSSTYVISLHREGRGFPLQLAYNLYSIS